MFFLIASDGFKATLQLVYLWPTFLQLEQVIEAILEVSLGAGFSYWPFLLLVCALPLCSLKTGASMSILSVLGHISGPDTGYIMGL